MSIHDDSTQQLRVPRPEAEAPTSRMPGPLDLTDSGASTGTGSGADVGTGWPDPPSDDTVAEPAAPAERTEVLFLDEIFDGPAPTAEAAAPAPAAPAAAEAPTWTAMPVVPVRSEPVHAYDAPAATDSPTGGRAGTAQRLRADAQAAWVGTVRRTSAWLGSGDNAVILLTTLVAILLIVVVAAFA